MVPTGWEIVWTMPITDFIHEVQIVSWKNHRKQESVPFNMVPTSQEIVWTTSITDLIHEHKLKPQCCGSKKQEKEWGMKTAGARKGTTTLCAWWRKTSKHHKFRMKPKAVLNLWRGLKIVAYILGRHLGASLLRDGINHVSMSWAQMLEKFSGGEIFWLSLTHFKFLLSITEVPAHE